MIGFGHLTGHRRRLRGGSRSFHAAARLLPARVREPATVLYAFCRVADDAIDESDDSQAALAVLRARLDRIYRGVPGDDPIDIDFAHLVERFQVPRQLPEALLEGFAWDAEGRLYEDLDAVRAYAARVAGSVGVMMALLMGVRDRALLARASDLGCAMQLTNIARDVVADAAIGRLYLPLDWMRCAGIDPHAWLANPRPHPGLSGVVERLLVTADRHYRAADAGIGGLPADCRFGIRSARELYCGIGDEVRRRGCDPFAGRAVVPRLHKVRLVIRAMSPVVTLPSELHRPVIATSAFLVDAAMSASGRGPERMPGGLLSVWRLFMRLEHEERERRGQNRLLHRV